jgi:hypothetical protein
MTRFRPCIDLHSGQVKQIVGGTLTTASADLKTNYVSKLPASHFTKLYKNHDLTGAHVIMLGPGNEEAAKEALAEWRGGLQVGGGITDANASKWIEWGAEKVCILKAVDLYFSLPSSFLRNNCTYFAMLMYSSRLSLLPTSSHLGTSPKNDSMLSSQVLVVTRTSSLSILAVVGKITHGLSP